jgi:hypothetical protein
VSAVSIDPTDDRRVVRVYLGDHLAVMRVGSALATRMRDSPHHGEVTDLLDDVTRELDDGGRTVTAYLAQLGAAPPRLKLLGALAAERVGRAKLNGRLAHRSRLSDLLELEGLRGAVAGSGAFWRALERAEIAAEEPVRAHAEACEALAARIEEARLAAAERVLRGRGQGAAA